MKANVERAEFNYETESFMSKEYTLPYIINEKGKKEYVLLTPKDILREDEPAINRKSFLDSYDEIRLAIDNDVLRAYVNNYFSKAVLEYEEQQRKNKKKVNEKSIKRIERQAFSELIREYPELYDYYIKIVEDNPEQVNSNAKIERDTELEKLCDCSKNIVELIIKSGYTIYEELSAREEAKRRIKEFKHLIEDCDGYKNLYYKGEQIALEKELQRLFRFVWVDTTFKVDSEPNNGRGQADFIVSKGKYNQNVIEFKLASNNSLDHVFTQVEIYETANCSEGSLIVIFFFTKQEEIFARNIIKSAGYENMIDESIFLIDCRKDNKKSASIA